MYTGLSVNYILIKLGLKLKFNLKFKKEKMQIRKPDGRLL